MSNVLLKYSFEIDVVESIITFLSLHCNELVLGCYKYFFYKSSISVLREFL